MVLEIQLKGAPRAFLFFGALGVTVSVAGPATGWGVDACLTAHVDAPAREKYLSRLEGSGIRVLRERSPNAALVTLKQRGYTVVAFATLPNQPKIVQAGNALPENLLEVFAGGRQLAHQYAGEVDAWEMLGEPDVGYCRDLPDRVAAYQKAVYLGLKFGAHEAQTTPAAWVLMGALALPPGPWLARATANGLLDYTDAYNFHFYGHAADLPGVITAHRRAAGSGLPLWITECGIKTVRDPSEDNAGRRALQAEFIVQTAEQAWRAPDVALFMPFILVHPNDPFALTLGPDRSLPAWDAYMDFTRHHPWPNRPLSRASIAPNPVVVQWLPDNATCAPHKVSGSYRFVAEEIRGALTIYNFSPRPVRGRLTLQGLRRIRATMAETDEITVAPMSAHAVAVGFSHSSVDGYLREECHVSFQETPRASHANFALETKPRAEDFAMKPLELGRAGDAPQQMMFPEDVVTSRDRHWLGTNGVVVEEGEPGRQATDAARLRVFMERRETDPLRSRLAVARVTGLPANGFVRLMLDRPMDRTFAMCVDLLDRKGQRFTIWENFGVDYGHPEAKEVWLNLADFHPYFWGRCMEVPALHPSEVEEIQLRLYVSQVNDPREIALSIATPRDAPATPPDR